jgi:NAD(P)-dependent dehydrogenase (short-subunit alcohol dehydrogenase family)
MTDGLEKKVAMVTLDPTGVGAGIAIRLAADAADVGYAEARLPGGNEVTLAAIEQGGHRFGCRLSRRT